MMRTFGRLSMTRAQTARAFWRRSAARFRVRLYGLSGYPWPTQRSPKFVFAVSLASWLTNRTAKKRALSAERRSRQPRREPMSRQSAALHVAGGSTRNTVRGQASSTAKTLRESARVAPRKPAQPIAAKRIAVPTTSRRITVYGRVIRPDRSIAFRRAAMVAREVVKTRWLGGERIWREVQTRFVERGARSMSAAIAARRSAGTNDARAWRTPRRAAHIAMRSARRRREAAVHRRVDASRRRVAMIVRSAYRAHTLTNRRSAKSFVSSSRRAHRDCGRPGANSRTSQVRELPIRDRIFILRRFQIHRMASAARIVRATQAPRADLARPQYRWRRTDVGALRFFSRRSDRQPATAAARRYVHRAASSPRRFLAESLSSPRDYAVATLARYESAARPAMIMRQRTDPQRSREQATVGVRNAQPTQDSRTRLASHESDGSRDRSPRPPAAEEIRRILIPLLQETLFSERTMGRLANGVVSEVDRRDSVEQYRKTGGR